MIMNICNNTTLVYHGVIAVYYYRVSRETSPALPALSVRVLSMHWYTRGSDGQLRSSLMT